MAENVSGVVLTLALFSLCACSGTGAICERAGGQYAGGGCTHRWTPDELAARQRCEARGGAYLELSNSCVFRGGGV